MQERSKALTTARRGVWCCPCIQGRGVLAELARGLEVDTLYYSTVSAEPTGPVLDRLRERVAEQISILDPLLAE